MARSACGQLLLAFAVIFSLLIHQNAAKEFNVGGGGSMSWEVPPSDYTQLYNHWAEKNRFNVGDSLVFTYDAAKDSVLQVTKDAYDNCKTDLYIESFKDGHTVVKLNHSGPFYFISGNADHCKKNEKLVVIVITDRRISSSSPPHPPRPSTASPAPTGAVPTSPAPSPSETSDNVPESDHNKKKNDASSILLGSLGGFGAFIGSFLYMML